MLEKVVRYYTPGGLHAMVEGGKGAGKGHLKHRTEYTEVQTIYHKGKCRYTFYGKSNPCHVPTETRLLLLPL